VCASSVNAAHKGPRKAQLQTRRIWVPQASPKTVNVTVCSGTSPRRPIVVVYQRCSPRLFHKFVAGNRRCARENTKNGPRPNKIAYLLRWGKAWIDALLLNLSLACRSKNVPVHREQVSRRPVPLQRCTYISARDARIDVNDCDEKD
jgi:hypothetical protein